MTEERMADLVSGFEGDAFDDLKSRVRECERAFYDLLNTGNRDGAHRLKVMSEPMRDRFKEMLAHKLAVETCPMKWALDDQEKALGVLHPTLRRLVDAEKHHERSVLVMGPTKAGKSTAVTLMVRRCLRFIKDPGKAAGGTFDYQGSRLSVMSLRVPRIHWVYARALAQCSKYHPLGAGEPEPIIVSKHAPVLVIDDLGLERDIGDVVDVVHERYEKGLSTWTTTGLSMPELNDRYGEAFVRRLVEGKEKPGIRVDLFKASKASAA